MAKPTKTPKTQHATKPDAPELVGIPERDRQTVRDLAKLLPAIDEALDARNVEELRTLFLEVRKLPMFAPRVVNVVRRAIARGEA